MIRSHQPVMLNDVVQWLDVQENGVYVDGTFGRGGYSEALLSRKSTVWAFDRDHAAIASGAHLQKEYPKHLHLVHGRFSAMQDAGIADVDGVTLDLGVSSPQLDNAERGFSFRHDGPLDMRMGSSERTAADIVNHASEDELGTIIFTYGEERMARRVARAILKARVGNPITRTLQLAEIVRSVVPNSRDGIDPATRTFQGLRIAVNDELNELEQGLIAAESLLKKGGRLVIVSFHSLEDRIVKNFMKVHAGKMPGLSRHVPAANTNIPARLRLLTAKPITASEEEVRANPRARSAKLRAAEKITENESFPSKPMESLGVNPRGAGK